MAHLDIKKFLFVSVYLAMGLVITGLSFNGSVKGQPVDALDFDGSSDFVEVSHDPSLAISDNLTISWWMNMDNLSDYKAIMMKGNPNSNSNGDSVNYFLVTNDKNPGDLRFYIKDGNGYTYERCFLCLTNKNKWVHYAVTFSSGTLKFYKNGSLAEQQSLGKSSLPTNNSDGELFIARRKSSGGNFKQYFDGAIDELRIWSEVRSQTEIENYMHQELNASNFSNLEAYYNFNSGSGSTLDDQTGNNNDGTLKNSPSWVNSGAALTNNARLEQGGSYDNDVNATYRSNEPASSGGLEISESSSSSLTSGDNFVFGHDGATGQSSGGSYNGTNVEKEMTRQWEIDENAGGKNADLVFTVTETGISPGFKSSVNDGDYVLINKTIGSIAQSGADNTDATTNTITFNDVNVSSLYTIGTTDENTSPLPVELTHFKARKKRGQVVFNWGTASETNNSHFLLQRKKQDEWENLGKVQGHGTSTESHEYQYTDENPFPGKTNYYRLKQVDFDGSFEYHGIRAVDFKKDIQLDLNVRENPIGDRLRMTLNTKIDQKFRYKLFNGSGKVVKQGTWQLNQGRHNLSIPTNDRPKGVYFLRIRGNDKEWSRKLMK